MILHISTLVVDVEDLKCHLLVLFSVIVLLLDRKRIRIVGYWIINQR